MKQIKNMGINLKGIHFHCGSGHYGASGFSKGIAFSR
jgi:diaminopimelate decarboxylase